jgi:hypothetical protein
MAPDFFLRNLWRWKCGLPDEELQPFSWTRSPIPSLESLRQTEWCEEFDKLAKGKMIQASFRYGLFDKNKKYDFVEAMKNKIALYEKTHNLELLVDARNYCMLEFKKPKYPDAYYYCENDTEHAPLKKQ